MSIEDILKSFKYSLENSLNDIYRKTTRLPGQIVRVHICTYLAYSSPQKCKSEKLYLPQTLIELK